MSGGPPLADLLDMAFMRHALLAGIPVAALSGFVGWFMVLRSQVFTGDALSHVAFTGALGSLALGVSPQLGLLVCTVVVGVGLGLLGGRGRADDVVIGTVFAWVLGIGVLALSLYTASSAGTTASRTQAIAGRAIASRMLPPTSTARSAASVATRIDALSRKWSIRAARMSTGFDFGLLNRICV